MQSSLTIREASQSSISITKWITYNKCSFSPNQNLISWAGLDFSSGTSSGSRNGNWNERLFGLLVTCVNPQSSANLVNSAEKFRGPLSKITVSGIPEVLARSNLPRADAMQVGHSLTRSSIWLLRFGHQTPLFALSRHFWIPWWPVCILSNIIHRALTLRELWLCRLSLGFPAEQ